MSIEIIEKPNVSVFGLGYVGLPLILSFDARSIDCYGVDIDKEKIDKLNNAHSYIDDVSSEEVQQALDDGIIFTNDANLAIKNTQISIIAVPTPVSEQGVPELNFILSAVDIIGKAIIDKSDLDDPHIIVLESTTYPTTTEFEVKNKLVENNLIPGEDFTLAYSPERISPGDQFSIKEIPKLLGAEDEWTFNNVKNLYSTYGEIRIIKASSPRTAELTKLFENIFRQVNIALVNELAILCERMAIDVYEVIKLASTKPFGFLPHFPGPGLGGHCIPVDPYYLSYIAKKFQFSTRFINLSTEINDAMMDHVIKLIKIGLNRVNKSIKTSNILILGYAYKPNVSDYRNSPAIAIVKQLQKYGANINVADAYVSKQTDIIEFVDYKQSLPDADVVVILTPHDYFSWTYILDNLRSDQPLIDTRGVIDSDKYRKIDVGLGRKIDELQYFNRETIE